MEPDNDNTRCERNPRTCQPLETFQPEGTVRLIFVHRNSRLGYRNLVSTDVFMM